MSEAIPLEPLLYYMHERSNGTWSQFADATLSLGIEKNHALYLAQLLSENALVEFLWDDDKRWSVTSSVAVVSNRSGGSISLWGGTHRSADALRESGLGCEVGTRRIFMGDRLFTYRHGIRLQAQKWEAIRQYVDVVNGKDILNALPAIERLLSKYPEAEIPGINADVRRWSFERSSKWWKSPVDFAPVENSLWRVGARRWRFFRRGKLRSVPDWLGKWLVYAASHRGGYVAQYIHQGGYFTLPFGSLIPTPYLRAVLLNEGVAAPVDAARVVDRARSRGYSNVDEQVATTICEKLGIEMDVRKERKKEQA